MKDTYFFPPDNKLDRLATAYTYYADKGLNRFPETPIREGTLFIPRTILRGGRRNCFPAAPDLFLRRWIMPASQMMLEQQVGNTRLLSRKSVELMTQDQLGKIGPEQGFRAGLRSVQQYKSPLSELGCTAINWGGFFYTGFIVDPKEQNDGRSYGATSSHGRLDSGPRSQRARLSGDQRLRTAPCAPTVSANSASARELCGQKLLTAEFAENISENAEPRLRGKLESAGVRISQALTDYARVIGDGDFRWYRYPDAKVFPIRNSRSPICKIERRPRSDVGWERCRARAEHTCGLRRCQWIFSGGVWRIQEPSW